MKNDPLKILLVKKKKKTGRYNIRLNSGMLILPKFSSYEQAAKWGFKNYKGKGGYLVEPELN